MLAGMSYLGQVQDTQVESASEHGTKAWRGTWHSERWRNTDSTTQTHECACRTVGSLSTKVTLPEPRPCPGMLLACFLLTPLLHWGIVRTRVAPVYIRTWHGHPAPTPAPAPDPTCIFSAARGWARAPPRAPAATRTGGCSPGRSTADWQRDHVHASSAWKTLAVRGRIILRLMWVKTPAAQVATGFTTRHANSKKDGGSVIKHPAVHRFPMPLRYPVCYVHAITHGRVKMGAPLAWRSPRASPTCSGRSRVGICRGRCSRCSTTGPWTDWVGLGTGGKRGCQVGGSRSRKAHYVVSKRSDGPPRMRNAVGHPVANWEGCRPVQEAVSGA